MARDDENILATNLARNWLYLATVLKINTACKWADRSSRASTLADCLFLLFPSVNKPDKYMAVFERDGCKVKINEGVLSVSLKDKKNHKQQVNEYTGHSPPDVTLQVGSQKSQVTAYKEVLKKHIPYFNAMFSDNFQESTKTLIELGNDLDFQAVSKLTSFAYKGTFQVEAADIQSVYEVADQWGMTAIANICSLFMIRELDASNCLNLFHLAQMHSCDSLTEACLQVISEQFQAVSLTSSFLQLPSHTLSLILQLEDLNAGPCGEESILGAVMAWFHHNNTERKDKLMDVLSHVRMSHIPKAVAEKYFEHPDVKCIQGLNGVIRDTDEENERQRKQHFMVICGYLQSRTGPLCPRTACVEKFDSSDNQFIQLESLPESPSYGKAFSLLGKIVFVAVYVYADPVLHKRQERAVVWTYNSVIDSWRQNTEMFSEEALSHILRCLVNSGTVVHCPYNSVIYSVLVEESLLINVQCDDGDIFCDKKAVLPNLQSHLDPCHSGLQGLVHNGQLYIMGGYYGPEMERNYSNKVLVLSEDKTSWESRADMLIPRCDFSVVSFENKIIIVGGYGGGQHKRRLQICEYYDADLKRWFPLACLTQSRSHHSAVVVNKKIYTIGGKSYASQKMADRGGWHYGGARIVSDFVEVLDPVLISSGTATWEKLTRMTKSRCNFSTVVV